MKQKQRACFIIEAREVWKVILNEDTPICQVWTQVILILIDVLYERVCFPLGQILCLERMLRALVKKVKKGLNNLLVRYPCKPYAS